MQTDNLGGLLGIWRMDRVPNALIREFCAVLKGVMKRLTKVFSDGLAILKECGMYRVAKRVYVGECVGSRLVVRSRKMRIESVNNCLKKKKKCFECWASQKGGA